MSNSNTSPSLGEISQRFRRALPGPIQRSALRTPSEPLLAPSDTRALDFLQPIQPGAEVDDWILVERLDQGGMAEVWLAEDRSDKANKSAIKFPLPGKQDPSCLSSFARESAIATSLAHPHIIETFDSGDWQGRPWLRMEYIPNGHTLRDVVLAAQALRTQTFDHFSECARLIAEVAEGLAYLHRHQIIHRDVKPENVLISTGFHAKISDFGLSLKGKHTEANLTQTGDLLGTPFYMSPEQSAGHPERVDAASDQFSLGVVLYELLCLRLPYEGEGFESLLRQIRTVPPREPHAVRNSVPHALSAICLRALEKDPERRFPCMQDMADELLRFRSGSAVRAKLPSPWSRLKRWSKRDPIKARVLALGSIAFTTSLGLLTWTQLQIDKTRTREEWSASLADVVWDLAYNERVRSLEERANQLWPVEASRVEEYSQWLEEAQATALQLPRLRSQLGSVSQAAQGHPGTRSTPLMESALEALVAAEIKGTIALTDRLQWWHRTLSTLVRSLEELEHPETGLMGEGIHPDYGWGILRRLKLAKEMQAGMAKDGADRKAWEEDAARTQELYGFVLPPQVGLVPLGPDPRSGFCEYAHQGSGVIPSRGPDGELTLESESAIVLVLLPEHENYFRFANIGEADEQFRIVPVDAFFIGKHELSQAQWVRASGENPSNSPIGWVARDTVVTGMHPVEEVSWLAGKLILDRWGLTYPTEIQWEYASRAGTQDRFWCGEDPEMIAQSMNLADVTYATSNPAGAQHEPWDDLHFVTAPIHTMAPNPNGLHHTLGNVWEWCLDWQGNTQDEMRAGTGERLASHEVHKVFRGGSFRNLAEHSTVMIRNPYPPHASQNAGGLRVARPVVGLP